MSDPQWWPPPGGNSRAGSEAAAPKNPAMLDELTASSPTRPRVCLPSYPTHSASMGRSHPQHSQSHLHSSLTLHSPRSRVSSSVHFSHPPFPVYGHPLYPPPPPGLVPL